MFNGYKIKKSDSVKYENPKIHNVIKLSVKINTWFVYVIPMKSSSKISLYGLWSINSSIKLFRNKKYDVQTCWIRLCILRQFQIVRVIRTLKFERHCSQRHPYKLIKEKLCLHPPVIPEMSTPNICLHIKKKST